MPEIVIDNITQKRGMNRKTAHRYNPLFEGNLGPIRRDIILEATWLGYFEPYTIAPIQSYIAEMMTAQHQMEWVEQHQLQPFSVKVLTKERTFCEKLMSLVKFCFKPDSIVALNHKVRHIYDIHKLLIDKDLYLFFESTDFETMLLKVANDDFISYRNDNEWLYNHPATAILFSDTENTWNQIRKTYQTDFKTLVFGILPIETAGLTNSKGYKGALGVGTIPGLPSLDNADVAFKSRTDDNGNSLPPSITGPDNQSHVSISFRVSGILLSEFLSTGSMSQVANRNLTSRTYNFGKVGLLAPDQFAPRSLSNSIYYPITVSTASGRLWVNRNARIEFTDISTNPLSQTNNTYTLNDIMAQNTIVFADGQYRDVKIQQDAALLRLRQQQLSTAEGLFEPIARLSQTVRDTANAVVKHMIDVARVMAIGAGQSTNGLARNDFGWLPEATVHFEKPSATLKAYPNPAQDFCTVELPTGQPYNVTLTFSAKLMLKRVTKEVVVKRTFPLLPHSCSKSQLIYY